jgi:hypothetical protein
MKSLISSNRDSRTALSSCETKTKKGYIKTSDNNNFSSAQSDRTHTHFSKISVVRHQTCGRCGGS